MIIELCVFVWRRREGDDEEEAESDAEPGMYGDSDDDFEQAADDNLVEVHRMLRAVQVQTWVVPLGVLKSSLDGMIDDL